MIKIKLVCATGVSSNLLVDVLKRKAAEKKVDCEITSSSSMNITDAVNSSDVLVLGPQYGYKLSEVQALADGKCAVVTLKEYEYSSIEADKILDKAVEAYNAFKK
ncbi:PTS sugar transporter subunit IIB [Beduini massiliensis]|uniref:PTS sugar transporter subunit IIB n=1 Tax=Beduini massiliensis TaxID=1585974 RepID=UPI00059AB434|nr:hypothetical protein [Beduini massiliensis]